MISKSTLIAVPAIVGACLLLLLISPQVKTGDEVRYLFYAASLWHHLTLTMSAAEWANVSPQLLGYKMGLPYLGDGTLVGHPVYVEFILFPLAAFGSAGLRAGGLAAGILGLLCLFFVLRRENSPIAALPAVIIAALSIPLISYIHTYWIEVFVFCAVAIGIYQLPKAGKGFASDMWRAGLILLIPYVHLRASVIGAAIFIAFLARVYSAVGWRPIRFVALCILAALFLVLLLVGNYEIYGAITGSVTTARPPSPFEALSVVAMQATDIKGIFPYAPIWLLGCAGLIIASYRKNRLAIECLCFLVVALFTSIGVNPGEGWPARFFVALVPMLTVGLSFWFFYISNGWQASVTAVLCGLTAVNSILFLFAPNKLLENRQADTTFTYIFQKIGGLNIGLFEPVEGINPGLARGIMVALACVIGLCAYGSISKRIWPTVSAAVVILCFLEIGRVSSVPLSVTAHGQTLDIKFPELHRRTYVQIGHLWERWDMPPAWPTLTVTKVTQGGPYETISTRPNQVIFAACETGVSAVKVTGNNINLPGEAKYGVQAYKSDSILLAIYDKFFDTCE